MPSLYGAKDVDLDAGDLTPDLVVEVDLTSPSLNKLPIYAHLEVAEVWRFANGRPEILVLAPHGGYEAVERSRFLPLLKSEDLSRLVEEGLTSKRPD